MNFNDTSKNESNQGNVVRGYIALQHYKA